jgi:redox-sensitive bicupin YhaK (pirin superfamily)
MIRIYPAEARYSGDLGWLQCNFSFSFADYYDPENVNFGPLRVFNDDYIQPQKGFGTHPHRDMEIVTVALQGQLEHKDNTGGNEILRHGEVQRMTAGTGILHSEINTSPDVVANTLQLWFTPREKGLTPSYEQKAYDLNAAKNQLLPVISSRIHAENLTYINQDLSIFLSELQAGKTLDFTQEISRGTYLFLMEGELTLNHEFKLKRRDAARMTDLTQLQIEANKEAFFMLIDLPLS